MAATMPRTESAPKPPAPPEPAAAPPDSPPSPARRRPRVRGLLLALLGIVALVGAGMTAYRWWLDSQLYVSTDNAQIAGRLVQVGGTSAGRVADVRYDVGAPIRKDTVVATIYAPVPVGTTANGQPKLEFRPTSDALVEVTTPVDGVVIARSANAGDTVPAGQPILTLVDPRQLWVNANVEETQVRRLQIGQPVTVHVDTLDADLAGHVKAITPASAATFSLLPSQNTSGNFTKQTQLVPVKIELDQPDPRLSIGTSVEVKIRVQP
jgi:multidrug resistance efflux pump